MAEPFQPEAHDIHLAPNGQASTLPGGEAFWSLPPEAMAPFDTGWLVSEFVCEDHWPNWEMHPEGEEFVDLLSGDIEFLQDGLAGTTATRLSGRGAVLVPRGMWHTARVFAPSRLLFVTWGSGTQHKPVASG